MEINFPPSVAKNGTKYLDRIVLSGDRLVERKHVQYRAAQFMFGFDLSRGGRKWRERVAVHADQSSDSSKSFETQGPPFTD